MDRTRNKIGYLSGSALKIIAAILMVIDHVGVRMFPSEEIFRQLGRISFPIFCFFIAEGCHYTRNKLKKILTLFVMEAVFLSVYYAYTGEYYPSIFFTFFFSVLMIYLLDFLKKWSLEKFNISKLLLSLLIFLAACILLYYCCDYLELQYGFYGVMIPVFVALFDFKDYEAGVFKHLDSFYVRLFMLALGTLLLSLFVGYSLQIYSLFAIPLVALYNGKPGIKRLKYGFYLFYPLHLVLIEFIALLIGK